MSKNHHVAPPSIPIPHPSQSFSSSASGLSRPITAPVPTVTSEVHFLVHAAMAEVQRLAQERGWLERGFTALTIPWTELHVTLDNWKTVKVISSSDVPCPVVNGSYLLANITPGTEVQFAVHAGVACHAPHDTAGARDTAELWFNNDGQNYVQTTA